jgi:putative transposase
MLHNTVAIKNRKLNSQIPSKKVKYSADEEAIPSIVQSWWRNWARITPFFDYPPEIRKVIYTTNAIESVNMSLRKITKNRGLFPSDGALLKLFYLDVKNISKNGRCQLTDACARL